MRILNLGILAHVDAGKTSLTERLLHAAGVIDELGCVDDGNTQTDTLALERQRGITIKSAVVSFTVGDVAVNLIDTPGHPDFIAEVERVLERARRRGARRVGRRGRAGADPDPDADAAPAAASRRSSSSTRSTVPVRAATASCASIAERLTPALVPMGTPTGLGTRTAGFTRTPADPRRDAPTCSPSTTTRCWPPTSQRRAAVPAERLRRTLAEQTAHGARAPGVLRLGDHRRRRRRADRRHHRVAAGGRAATPTAPLSGSVFKVERGPAGDEGRVRPDVRRHASGPATGCAGPAAATAKVTGDRRVRRRRRGRVAAAAGRPDRQGLGPGRRADRRRGRAPPARAAPAHHFAPPTPGDGRRTARSGPSTGRAATPRSPSSPSRTRSSTSGRTTCGGRPPCRSTARCRRRSSRRRWPTSTASRSTFRETTTICIERPAGTGAAVEVIEQGRQPVPRHGRAAGRAGAGRRGRRVPAGGRVRARCRPRSSPRWRRPSRATLRRACTAGRSTTAR